MKFYLLLIVLFSCTDIFIPDDNEFKSIYLDGNAWIEIDNQYDCDNGLRVIDDSFLIEIYFSGGSNPTNDAGTLFSFVGKNTENFIDDNCNGEWDDTEDFIDTNGNDEWDSGVEFEDSEYIVLAISNDPSKSNVLSFYINNEREKIEINDADFTNSSEFHLLQVFITDGTLYFYLDNIEVYSKESDIMIQGESFMVGALANDSFIGNLWYGHIDEVRLWKSPLTNEIRSLHYSSADKLIDTMHNDLICDLVGLWTFNYDNPSSDIYDEKCKEINNLNENSCGCHLFLLDGVLYTLPGDEVAFTLNEF